MEKIIRRPRLPDTDSVEELAGFWDNHDLTDFADDLQEVSEPVFVRVKGMSLSIHCNLPRLSISRKSRAPRVSRKPPFFGNGYWKDFTSLPELVACLTRRCSRQACESGVADARPA